MLALETYLYMPFLLLHLSIHNQLLISVVHSARIFNNEDKDIFYVQKFENDHWHTKYEAEFKPKQIEDFI